MIDSQPAFPFNPGPYVNQGLTKREWLAGMAMQGQLASESVALYLNDRIVERAFILADAMIKHSSMEVEPK